MKIEQIVNVLIFIILFLYVCDTKISFNPFSIKVESWIPGIAFLFFLLGSILTLYSIEIEAEKRATEKVIETVTRYIEKESLKEIEDYIIQKEVLEEYEQQLKK